METSRLDKYDKDECEAYEEIARYKWTEDFICRKCGNVKHFEGKTPFSRRCSKCKSDESATAGTVFDKLRMPLPVALYIIREIIRSDIWLKSASLKKTLEESRGVRLRQQTIRDFLLRVYSSLAREHIIYDSEALYTTFIAKNDRVVVSRGKHLGKLWYDADPVCNPSFEGARLALYLNGIVDRCTKVGTKVAVFNFSTIVNKDRHRKRIQATGILIKNRPGLIEDEETRVKFKNEATEITKDVFPWIAGDHYNLYFFKRESNDYDDLMNRLTRHHI